jgi:hypothetical protein
MQAISASRPKRYRPGSELPMQLRQLADVVAMLSRLETDQAQMGARKGLLSMLEAPDLDVVDRAKGFAWATVD